MSRDHPPHDILRRYQTAIDFPVIITSGFHSTGLDGNDPVDHQLISGSEQ
jgi:hypothetical protein